MTELDPVGHANPVGEKGCDLEAKAASCIAVQSNQCECGGAFPNPLHILPPPCPTPFYPVVSLLALPTSAFVTPGGSHGGRTLVERS